MSADKDEGSLFYLVLVFLLSVPAAMVGMALRGWALAKLWLWFIVPTFGAAPLSYPVAYGVALVVGLATYQTPQDIKEVERGPVRSFLRSVIMGWGVPLFFVAVGALTRWWAA